MWALTSGHLILLLIALLVLVWGVIALRQAEERRQRDEALEILRQRYARGEIGEAEFEERRRFLRR